MLQLYLSKMPAPYKDDEEERCQGCDSSLHCWDIQQDVREYCREEGGGEEYQRNPPQHQNIEKQMIHS